MGCVQIPVMLYFGSKAYSGRGQRQCASAGDLAEGEFGDGIFESEAFKLCTLYGTAWCPGRFDEESDEDDGERVYELTTTRASARGPQP